MSANGYPEPVTDTTPPVPWWRARPRDWPERIVSILLIPIAFVCIYNLGGRGSLGIAAAVSCVALKQAAFVWWQRRRTPRPRQQREAAAAAGGSGL